MPLISRGLPAFASHASVGAASHAVDADYGTVWRTGHDPSPRDPDWLAIDLSSVPVAARTTVYSVWFNEYGYNYDTTGAPSYTLPGDFTIQANAAPGGGPPPVDGWTTLAGATGNRLGSGANLLQLGGYD
ncbi:MAG: dockerin type I domain-containing protein, partial [Polyangiaceae bacterium]